MVLRSALSANTPGDLALVAARRCTALWSRSGSSLGAVVATTMVLETPTCAAYHTNTTAETACHAPLTTVASAHY